MKGFRIVAAAGLLLAGAAGCGPGPKFARVTGVVTVNGKPYKNAVVSFQPMGTLANPNPGRGSSGLTDEAGRFALQTDEGQSGAVVGKHRVRIMTNYTNGFTFDADVGSPDDVPAGSTKALIDVIPPEWNALSTKEFDVPPRGTNDANFEIVGRKRK
jgi:hypothetical protein